MELFEIVMKLNGKVGAAGDTNIDEERFKNLTRLTELIDNLLFIVNTEAQQINSPEYSVKKSAKYAQDYLRGITWDV